MGNPINQALDNFDARIRRAIRVFWETRSNQTLRQSERGGKDHGSRGAVTGGRQMDGFVELLVDLLKRIGVEDGCIYQRQSLELPGFFRPTKEWDILMVKDGQLVLAIEAKSQVGPSFGNNFNNRTEEAIGSALDLWTAYEKGALGATADPWVGYLFHLEDCPRSRRPVNVREPHYPVFDEFRNASYAKRYEELCRRLVRRRHYSAAALLLSREGSKGAFVEPASDLLLKNFAQSMLVRALAFVD